MNRVCCILPLFLIVSTSIAQESLPAKIQVEYRVENDKIQLVCANDNNIAGYFSIHIRLTNPENISSSNTINRVTTSGAIIETFRPTDVRKKYNLGSFSYYYLRGRYTSKPNLDVVYRLPVSSAKTIKVMSLSYVGEKYGDEKTPDGWRPFQFNMVQGDTIYAARRGRVVEIIDDVDYIKTDGYVSYNSAANRMIVEHDDGTLAKYDVLEKGSIMVKLGDIVFPSTPIALAGSYDGTVWQLRFSVYHTVFKSSFEELKPFTYLDVNPIFATTKGEVQLVYNEDYQPIVTDKLIEAEMKKSEIAKRRK